MHTPHVGLAGVRKCNSSPCLIGLEHSHHVAYVRQPHGKTAPGSCSALQLLDAPVNALEYLGFQSMLHVSQQTVCECAAAFPAAGDFPRQLLGALEEAQLDDAVSVAACLAGPTEAPDARGQGPWLRTRRGGVERLDRERLVKRCSSLRTRLRRKTEEADD